jgi:hypothetical protein
MTIELSETSVRVMDLIRNYPDNPGANSMVDQPQSILKRVEYLPAGTYGSAGPIMRNAPTAGSTRIMQPFAGG